MDITISSQNSSRCEVITLDYNELINFIDKLEQDNQSVCFIIDRSLLQFDEYKSLLKGKKAFYIKANEEDKVLETVSKIYDFLLENKEDRNSFLLGIGGGITLDITGFVASTYMRGVRFGFVPTTLLAMVDASIGGKNGVNFRGFKNYIGTFNHPSFIAITSYFLNTLSDSEFKNGMAEVIKYGAISKSDLIDFIILNKEKILSKDKNTLNYLIEESVKIKSNIVIMDFKESGIRKVLNFGHTLGHALERLKKVSHGEGVAAGMVFASLISLNKGYLTKNEFLKIEKVISEFGLPVFIDGVAINDIVEGIAGDKKKKGNMVDFVLLKKIGEAFVETMDLLEIRDELEYMFKYYREKY